MHGRRAPLHFPLPGELLLGKLHFLASAALNLSYSPRVHPTGAGGSGSAAELPTPAASTCRRRFGDGAGPAGHVQSCTPPVAPPSAFGALAAWRETHILLTYLISATLASRTCRGGRLLVRPMSSSAGGALVTQTQTTTRRQVFKTPPPNEKPHTDDFTTPTPLPI